MKAGASLRANEAAAAGKKSSARTATTIRSAACTRSLSATGLRSAAERAWLREFGVAFVADVYDEMSESLMRAVRRML